MKDYLKKQEVNIFDTKKLSVGDYVRVYDYESGIRFTGCVLGGSPYQILIQRINHHNGIKNEIAYTPNSMIEFEVVCENECEELKEGKSYYVEDSLKIEEERKKFLTHCKDQHKSIFNQILEKKEWCKK